jgi:allantoinase
LAAEPASLAGLASRKGEIAPTRDADLVVFDQFSDFVVDPDSLEHRHPLTPYAGRTLTGVVKMVTLRGVMAGPLTEGLLVDGPRAKRTSP